MAEKIRSKPCGKKTYFVFHSTRTTTSCTTEACQEALHIQNVPLNRLRRVLSFY